MKSTFVCTGDSKWSARTGETVEILRQLTSAEADAEVGLMYRIRFCDGTETDAFIDELLGVSEYQFGEVIYDITTCASCFIMGLPDCRRSGEYDSRELYACIFEWAKEFEKKYPAPGFDYLLLVEEFAYVKLREYFELEG